MKNYKMAVMAKLLSLILLLEAMVTSGFRIGPAANSLSMDYYVMSCAFVEPVVRNIVNQALQNDPNLAAGLIRMHFHDCFIQVLFLPLYVYELYIGILIKFCAQ